MNDQNKTLKIITELRDNIANNNCNAILSDQYSLDIINANLMNGITPLIYALTINSDTKCASILLKMNAQLLAVDDMGRSPMTKFHLQKKKNF